MTATLTATTASITTLPVSPAIVSQISQPTEPRILSANTFYWTPGGSADNRRRNEKRNIAEVAAYFEALDFDVTTTAGSVHAEGHGLSIHFTYSESCANVYKSLSVERQAKGGEWTKSNVTAIRKIAAAAA